MSAQEADVTVAIVIIGDEILNGFVVDKNARLLIEFFRKIGYEVREILFVRDQEAVVASAIKRLSARYTYLFTTGGIGPTHDDVTLAAAAHAFDLSLHTHADMHDYLVECFPHLPSHAVENLSHLPQEVKIYGNKPHWPIITLRNLFFLPGIPHAIKNALLRIEQLLPFSKKSFWIEYTLRCSELDIYAWLEKFQQQHALHVGIYPSVSVKKRSARVIAHSSNTARLDAADDILSDYFKTHRWLKKKRRRP